MERAKGVLHRKIALWIGLVASSLGGVAAQAQDAAQTGDRFLGMIKPVVAKKPYRIGFASADMNSDFFLGEAYGVTDEAKQSNVQLVRVFSAGGFGNVAQQIGQLEQLAALGVDAIVVTPAAYEGFDKEIDRLTEKGIKVVTVGTPASSPKISFGVLQDDAKIGRTLGEYACSKKPGATVITLPGPAGGEWNQRRFKGFQDAAEKCNLKLVGNTFTGQISVEDGQRQAADFLLKYPDADYVYAVAGIFSVGVAQQVQHSNSKAQVITGTFTRRTSDLLKNGIMGVVVSEPPIVLGRVAVQYAIRALNGDDLPGIKIPALPFPIAFIPNNPVTAKDLATYDVNAYDLPPQGWKPPNLQ